MSPCVSYIWHDRAVARGELGGLQPPQFLTDQLTLSQPGGADYAHHSTTSPPGFSDLATGLEVKGSLFR